MSLERNYRNLVHECPGDLTTPVGAFQRLRPLGARFLLESVEGGERSSRYSFIGLAAAARLWADTDGVWCAAGERPAVRLAPVTDDPLDVVIHFAQRYQGAADPRAPRLLGGLVGYIAYDYIRRLERLGTRPAGSPAPTLVFELVSEVLVFDHLQHRLHHTALANSRRGATDERLEQVLTALAGPDVPSDPPVGEPRFRALMSDDDYRCGVARLQKHIAAGDIFQAVLSREVEVLHAPPMFEVYRALRRINPSPYMFFLDLGDVCLAGSSPESAVRLSGRRAALRPIAGTRPRGADEETDLALERELCASRKERAEHAMLVDLARNDLARVAVPGTVQVRRAAQVERYSHVMHLVSDVEATLGDAHGVGDLIRATFPAGTVSGAPKIRAMQLIDELETTPRNLYAGCAGYIGCDGSLDMALTIRSAMLVDGRMTIRAGAGVVAGSTPDGELAECRAKLGALTAAITHAGCATTAAPRESFPALPGAAQPTPAETLA